MMKSYDDVVTNMIENFAKKLHCYEVTFVKK